MLDSEDTVSSWRISSELHLYANGQRRIILSVDDLVVTDVQFYQDGPEPLMESICHDASD